MKNCIIFLVFILLILNVEGQQYLLLQLKDKPDIFICKADDIIKINKLELLSYSPYIVGNEKLIVKWGKYIDPFTDSINVICVTKTYDLLVGYKLTYDSLILYTRKTDKIQTNVFINERFAGISSFSFNNCTINASEDRLLLFDKMIIFNKDSTYKLIREDSYIELYDRNAELIRRYNNTTKGGMGLGDIRDRYYNPQFSCDGNNLLIERQFSYRAINSIEEINCRNGEIIEICNNCRNPQYSTNSEFILYESQKKQKKQLFLSDYFIYDKMLNENIKIENIRSAFWCY